MLKTKDMTLWEHFRRAPKDGSKGGIPKICRVSWTQMSHTAKTVNESEQWWGMGTKKP